MVNYNQKYKDEVIVAINETNDASPNYFDSTFTDNKYFSAVGQQTSSNLINILAVQRVGIYATKPDTILNLADSNIRIYDDDGTIETIALSGLSNAQYPSIGTNMRYPLKFTERDTNITFDNYAGTDGMTKEISNLADKTKVQYFDLNVTLPSDVTCNYNTGNHAFIKTMPVNVLFEGNIKTGDTITVKRSGKTDMNATVRYDTDLLFTRLDFDNSTNAEFIYNRGKTPEPDPDPTPEPEPDPEPTPEPIINFTSDSVGATWSNATMTDVGTNIVTIQKGYKLTNQLKVECTQQNGTIDTKFFGGYSIRLDGDDSENNQLTVTIPTGYVKFNITDTNIKYKEYDIEPTLQNATIIDPPVFNDDYAVDHYYLSPKQTTVTIKASAGYTFENDGTLTYQQDETNTATLTIKATHTDTITVSLPSDINWQYQTTFPLTIGAVQPDIVDNAGGFTNIYKADYNNLLNFSKEVITIISGGGSGVNVETYDIKQYINNLIMIPFDVPSDETTAIVAGDETFTTKLPTVDNDYLTVDLGKITVPEQYKNGFDYYQVKTRLMLPYTNMVDLDPTHVINKTVAIKYIVNVVNGDTTINLYNDNDLFYSNQVNLANEVPFISNSTNGSQYAVINQLKTMFRNDIHQAYIIIEQPTPILNSDYYDTNEKGTLQGYNGNVKVSLLNNMDINVDELKSLQNILETGVYIKWL